MTDPIKLHAIKKLRFFVQFGYPLGLSYLGLFAYMDAGLSLLAPIVFLIGVTTSHIALAYGRMALANSAGIFSALLAAMIATATSGGPNSPIIIWLAVIPAVAPLILTYQMSLVLGTISLVYTGCLFLVDRTFIAVHNEMTLVGMETALHIFSVFGSIIFTVTVSSFAAKEREKTIQLVDQSRAWNEMIVQNIGECLIVINGQGKIISTNHQGKELFGYDTDALAGMSIATLIPKAGGIQQKQDLAVTPESPASSLLNPLGQEFTALHRDGHEIPLRLKVRSFNRNDEDLFVCLAYDLSNQKKMAKDIEEQRAFAFQSAKFASLGQLAGSIGHEINTPLGSIMLSASSLRGTIERGELDPKRVKRHVDLTLTVVKKIAQIVSALKGVGGIRNNDEMAPIDLHQMLDEVIAIVEPRAKISDISLTVQYAPEDLAPEIIGNAAQLNQIFINLINNSIDALLESRTLSLEDAVDQEAWIRLHVQSIDNQIEFRLTDSGRGVPPEVADRMFDPFYTTKDIGKGTGIGLSISKKIANNHDGDLYLDRACANTSFVLTLPLKPVLGQEQPLRSTG